MHRPGDRIAIVTSARRNQKRELEAEVVRRDAKAEQRSCEYYERERGTGGRSVVQEAGYVPAQCSSRAGVGFRMCV